MQDIAEYMNRAGLVLVTAESCTAGLIASRLAEIPGAGKLLECAYVVYSPDAKQRCLGVSPQTLEKHNLTSEAVAREMVLGAISRSNANVAVSNTGVTDSTDPDIPAGTQCFAWVFRRHNGSHDLHSETRLFEGSRNDIREAAADFALRRIPELHRAERSILSDTSNASAAAGEAAEAAEANAAGADTEDRHARQSRIVAQLGVATDFEAAAEIERRIEFLSRYLVRTGRRGYVLGISGGVDSLLAGHLAQQAVKRVRRSGRDALFYAVRLPYGVQQDESAAQKCLASIGPDRSLAVDIKPACDSLLAALRNGVEFRDAGHEDFVTGNIKARQRMVAQYAIAGAYDGLVIGTDQAAEALMGFFTKYGDGAADVTPLTGLSKRRVRAMARALGAPEELVMKVPTADLESLAPMRPDEDAFGVSYEEIDDFLEGKPVSEAAAELIIRTYRATGHKRELPVWPREG